MDAELKPCPCCGSTVEVQDDDYIMCNGCGLMMSRCDAPEGRYIDAWNRRAKLPSPPVVAEAEPVGLTVWEGAMPESNGKTNYTAVLVRKGESGIEKISNGMTIMRSEYPGRVRYEADCVRWLIGELTGEKPCVTDYDTDEHSGYAAPPASGAVPVQQAHADVLAERRRQVEKEGWTPQHDDEHDGGELAAAASAYALYAADELSPHSQGDGDYGRSPPPMWPFHRTWWKPESERGSLVKAGALILAEIERIDRALLAKEVV